MSSITKAYYKYECICKSHYICVSNQQVPGGNIDIYDMRYMCDYSCEWTDDEIEQKIGPILDHIKNGNYVYSIDYERADLLRDSGVLIIGRPEDPLWTFEIIPKSGDSQKIAADYIKLLRKHIPEKMLAVGIESE